jgi:hypothetical protein
VTGGGQAYRGEFCYNLFEANTFKENLGYMW